MSENAPERAFLSKSTFIRGMQCEKSLYLHKKRPFLRDRLPPEQLAKFSRGHKVGELARDLFPGGVNMAPASHFQMGTSIRKTAQAIKSAEPVLYEAGFQHQGVRVALDILHRGANGWHAVEVKSSRSISATYLWDASLQYHVITGSGTPLQDFCIAHVNPDYVRRGPLEPGQLFRTESVLEQVLQNQDAVAKMIGRFREVAALTSSPGIDVGSHCLRPYPCDFIGHCWKKAGENTPPTHAREPGLPGKDAVQALFAGATQPLCCYSSLHFAPAVPLYDGTSPYQKLGFSFVIGLAEGSGTGPGGHWWCPPGGLLPDPLLMQLLEHLEGAGSILVFGKAEALEVLTNLVRDRHDLKDRIGRLAGRMLDLQSLFSPWLARPSGLSLHDSPGQVLAYFGQKPARDDVPPHTSLEAALAYQELAENPGLSDGNARRRIGAFHQRMLGDLCRLADILLNLVPLK